MSRPQGPTSQTCPRCLAPGRFDTIDAKPSCIPIDILKTNRPPTDIEILCIRSTIDETRARKAELEARIVTLQSILNKLLADHKNIREEIWIHEGTLSPLRRMPTELLSLIFVFAFRPARDARQNSTPWTASQVCHRWRAIILSQPSFWASIDLDFRRMRGSHTKTTFGLETQLKRSGNIPLDIDFGCRWERESSEQELDLLKVLVQHCARWEKIRIQGPLSLSSDLASIRGNLPLLRKLQVLLEPPPRHEAHSLDVFELAPSLREASVNMVDYWQAVVDVRLPFSGLLQYAGRNTWDGHLSVLHSASNLVECALDIEEDDRFTISTTMVALPHLLRLSLSNSKLLDCLDVPQLEELYCSSHSNHLSSLFRRQPPQQLRKLVLFFPASVIDIAGTLRSVPTITEMGVSVRAEAFDELFAQLLLRNKPTDIGLPLRSMVICCGATRIAQSFLRYDEDMLVNMMTSRWRSGRLRSITIPDTDFWLEGNERLKVLESEGFAITFTSKIRCQSHIEMVPHQLRFKNHQL
ncbi:hypothetical protein MVEN_00953700 [Mycena venus]|uniref:F-box domain-containing protein n=1 Tax=Mycena venus TaxID=2733690 RepID=A0A8H6Y8E0_9AGAR|nr:hypothetical protein MVEN_00953700 [Mycena venus]